MEFKPENNKRVFYCCVKYKAGIILGTPVFLSSIEQNIEQNRAHAQCQKVGG
jgi:hypothetical protein